MATQWPKLRSVLQFIFWLPAWLCGALCCWLWEEGVQKPRLCRKLKRQGRSADLQSVQLWSVSLPGVCLEAANLSGALIMKSDLRGADLRNAILSNGCVHSTNLQAANLRGANLQWAGLIGTDLQGADMSGSDLTRATTILSVSPWPPPEFQHMLTPKLQATMDRLFTSLAGADLTGATLIAADLLDADLTGTKLTGARADVRTRWPEGFDPKQHGVEIAPFATEWHLKQGSVVLGALRDCHPDYRPRYPCFRGQFTPTPAFEEVRPVFDEAVRLRETDQQEEYFQARQAIDRLGLQLESLEGDVLKPYTLYIEGGEAWFRY
jgi:hypothetical protein